MRTVSTSALWEAESLTNFYQEKEMVLNNRPFLILTGTDHDSFLSKASESFSGKCLTVKESNK